jgi:hypothetical protein
LATSDPGRWQTFSLIEQLAHIGSEVERALAWQAKGDAATSQAAFFRALELLDLTLADRRHRGRFREVARIREILVDYFAGENAYQTRAKKLADYFLSFAYAARNRSR